MGFKVCLVCAPAPAFQTGRRTRTADLRRAKAALSATELYREFGRDWSYTTGTPKALVGALSTARPVAAAIGVGIIHLVMARDAEPLPRKATAVV